MKLTEISSNINEWLSGQGPLSEIVISSRIRLARNLAGHKFVSRCSSTEKTHILENLREVLLAIDLGDER
jgi:protein arginine kinase